MTPVYLGIGSNIDREVNLCSGLQAIERGYGPMRLSPVYESAAIGFDGEPFLNLVVAIRTTLAPATLAAALRELEYAMGRPANATRFSARTLDIDILTYADLVGKFDGLELPRPEITENAFVLRPLAELAPAALHPVLRRSYAELWADYDQARQPLNRVALKWGEREL